MKKIIFFLIGLVFFANSVYAVPVKGPFFLKKKKLEVGAEANIVIRRDIEKITTNLRSSQFFYCMAYGIFDWLNIEAKFGTGDIGNDQYNDQKFYYKYNWGGGYGLRLKAYESRTVKLILGWHHTSIHPDPNESTDNLKHKAILDETQFDAIVALKGERFSPYSGIKGSCTRLIRRIGEERTTLHGEENYGFILGFDYMFNDHTRLNLESRFVDEYALTCGVSYIF